MDSRSRKQTLRYSSTAAVAAFVTQPIPALDELIVVPIHYWFSWRFAYRRKAKVLKLPWRSLQRIIWYGAAARLVANFSLGLVPVVGAFSNAVTAIALTEYLAQYLDASIENPDLPPPEITMQGLKDLFIRAIKKKQAETAPDGAGVQPS